MLNVKQQDFVNHAYKMFNKDVLTIEGNNATTVGNFANSVRNLKYPDSYKGKGIWYKNEFRTLKPVKKV